MSHTWDPDRYLAYADERGRPFVDLLARVPAERPRVVVDLGCGPGNLTALLADRWVGAEVTGVDSSPEMIEAARAVDGVHWEVGDLREWARPDPLALRAPIDVLVSNATLQWMPGAPRPAAGPRRPPAARWLVRLPGARQLRRAQPHHPHRPRRTRAVRRARARRPRPREPRPGGLRPRPARPRLRGRRVGDDVPPRPHRRGPRLRLGLRHRAPARRCRRCPTTCARCSRTSSSRCCARPTRPTPPAAWCCRSAGSSSSRASRRACRSREAPPRAGRLPARGRGRGPPLLRRGARHDRGRQAGRPGGARRLLVPGVRRRGRGGRAARRRRGPVRAGAQGAPGLRRRRSRAVGRSAARPWASRSTRASGDSFPGHVRLHTFDGHGNRVEVLAAGLSDGPRGRPPKSLPDW